MPSTQFTYIDYPGMADSSLSSIFMNMSAEQKIGLALFHEATQAD